MKATRSIRGGIAALACSGMLLAQTAQAATPPALSPSPAAAVAPAIRDVALEDAGVFRGQIVDAQGKAQAAVPVCITKQGQEVARTKTDEKGQFAASGLSGGVYEVHTPISTTVYRAWSPRTAPPAATQVAVIVPEQNIVRAQMRGGSALGWLANPWVLAGIVAAAIAIPLALDDDDAS